MNSESNDLKTELFSKTVKVFKKIMKGSNKKDYFEILNENLFDLLEEEQMAVKKFIISHLCLIRLSNFEHEGIKMSKLKVFNEHDDLISFGNLSDLISQSHFFKKSIKNARKSISISDTISQKQKEFDHFLKSFIKNYIKKCSVSEYKSNVDLPKSNLKKLKYFDAHAQSNVFFLLNSILSVIQFCLQIDINFVKENCFNLMNMILSILEEYDSLCEKSLELFTKIFDILLIQNELKNKKQSINSLEMILNSFPFLIQMFYSPLHEYLLDFINLTSKSKNKDSFKKLKKKGRKKKNNLNASNISNVSNPNLDEMENMFLIQIRKLNCAVWGLLISVLNKFTNKISLEEGTLCIQILNQILLTLEQNKLYLLQDLIKEQIFSVRSKILKFIISKVHFSNKFKPLLELFFSLEKFNIFGKGGEKIRKFSVTEFTKTCIVGNKWDPKECKELYLSSIGIDNKLIKLRNINKSEHTIIINEEMHNLQITHHNFLDNFIYPDYDINMYKGQIFTQKDYLILIYMLLKSDEKGLLEIADFLISFISANKKSDKELLIEIILICHQIVLIKLNLYSSTPFIKGTISIKNFSYEKIFFETSKLIKLVCPYILNKENIKSCFELIINLYYVSSSQNQNSNIMDSKLNDTNSLMKLEIPDTQNSNELNEVRLYLNLNDVLCDMLLCLLNRSFDYFSNHGTDTDIKPKEFIMKNEMKRDILLKEFKVIRDELFQFVFSKIDSNSECSQNQYEQYSERAVQFLHLVKKEIDFSSESEILIENFRKFFLQFKNAKSEKIIKIFIEVSSTLHKKIGWTETNENDPSLIFSIYENSKEYLKKHISQRNMEFGENELIELFKLRFSSIRCCNEKDLVEELDFVKDILDNYTIEFWNYKPVEVISSCLRIYFHILQSAFFRMFEISKHTEKEKIFDNHLSFRPKAIQTFQKFLLFVKEKNKLNYEQLLKIRKEAFEVLIKSYVLVSNDMFQHHRFIYRVCDDSDIDNITGFLFECVGLHQYNSTNKDRGDNESLRISLNNDNISNNNSNSRNNNIGYLNSAQKDLIMKDKELKKIEFDQNDNLDDEKSNLSTISEGGLNKDTESNLIETERSIEFWSSTEGKELTYYFVVLVCELLENCSASFGNKLGPKFIFQMIMIKKLNPDLERSLSMFLKSILLKDIQESKKGLFWIHFLKVIQYPEIDKSLLLKTSKIFIKVFSNTFEFLKKGISISKMEMLRDQTEEIKKRDKKLNNLQKQYLSFCAYFIHLINPDANDFKKNLSFALTEHFLKRKYFRNEYHFSDCLLRLFEKMNNLIGNSNEVISQKKILENFISVALKQVKNDEQTIKEVKYDNQMMKNKNIDIGDNDNDNDIDKETIINEENDDNPKSTSDFDEISISANKTIKDKKKHKINKKIKKIKSEVNSERKDKDISHEKAQSELNLMKHDEDEEYHKIKNKRNLRKKKAMIISDGNLEAKPKRKYKKRNK